MNRNTLRSDTDDRISKTIKTTIMNTLYVVKKVEEVVNMKKWKLLKKAQIKLLEMIYSI